MALAESTMKREPYVCLGRRIREILEGRKLTTACGYNDAIGYDDWKHKFATGPLFAGY